MINKCVHLLCAAVFGIAFLTGCSKKSAPEPAQVQKNSSVKSISRVKPATLPPPKAINPPPAQATPTKQEPSAIAPQQKIISAPESSSGNSLPQDTASAGGPSGVVDAPLEMPPPSDPSAYRSPPTFNDGLTTGPNLGVGPFYPSAGTTATASNTDSVASSDNVANNSGVGGVTPRGGSAKHGSSSTGSDSAGSNPGGSRFSPQGTTQNPTKIAATDQGLHRDTGLSDGTVSAQIDPGMVNDPKDVPAPRTSTDKLPPPPPSDSQDPIVKIGDGPKVPGGSGETKMVQFALTSGTVSSQTEVGAVDDMLISAWILAFPNHANEIEFWDFVPVVPRSQLGLKGVVMQIFVSTDPNAPTWESQCAGRLVRMVYLGDKDLTTDKIEGYFKTVRKGDPAKAGVKKASYKDYPLNAKCEVDVSDFPLFSHGSYMALLAPAGTVPVTALTEVVQAQTKDWEGFTAWAKEAGQFEFLNGFWEKSALEVQLEKAKRSLDSLAESFNKGLPSPF